MEKPSVTLRFKNNEEIHASLARVPVAGDWISVEDDEYQVSKVILVMFGTSIAVIEDELRKRPEPGILDIPTTFY
tara:strand:- start:108 stop:332 length:225 start_codon:yes stop_codon:yes gene_type:complete